MLGFLANLIPNNYKWEVAVKYVSMTVAKTAISFLAGTAAGNHVSPENWEVVAGVTTTLTAGALKFIHDWAKVKYGETEIGKKFL